MSLQKKFSFEDKYEVIQNEIWKRNSKWKLKAVPSISFEDISQILLIHINIKWEQWNQDFALEPWLNRLITNQIRNLIRNNYSNFSRPCLSCAANQGATLCSIYGEQCTRCPLFRKWSLNKKNAHDTKLPVSIENHSQEIFSMPTDGFDIERSANILHLKMKKVLKPIEWKVYQLLYVDFKEDAEVAKIMGYKSSEEGRKPGYKQIKNLKKKIVERAKRILAEEGVE